MASTKEKNEARIERAIKTVNFLARENLLEKFITNLFEATPTEYEVGKGFAEDFEEADYQFYKSLGNRLSGLAEGLDCSFTWCETPEGHEFWQSMNQKFMDEEKATNLCKEYLEGSLTIEQLYNEISFMKKGYASTDIDDYASTDTNDAEASE